MDVRLRWLFDPHVRRYCNIAACYELTSARAIAT
jgi:hypothetical protein